MVGDDVSDSHGQVWAPIGGIEGIWAVLWYQAVFCEEDDDVMTITSEPLTGGHSEKGHIEMYLL